MKRINYGGCECRDCGNGDYGSRARSKREWVKEMQTELYRDTMIVNLALAPDEHAALVDIARRLGLSEAAAIRYLIAHYNA